MSKTSRDDVLIGFALLSFLALAVLGGGLVWLGAGIVRARAQESASRSAVAAGLPALQTQVSDLDLRLSLPAPSREVLDARIASSGLLSDSTVRLRIWNESGIMVYSTQPEEIGAGFIGTDELDRALGGEVASSVAASDLTSTKGDVFQIYAVLRKPGGAPTVLEIDQPYGPVADAIEAGQREWLFSVAGPLALLYLVIQGVFWFTTRTMAHQLTRLNYLYTTSQQLRSSLDLAEVLAQLARDAALLSQATYGVLVLVEGSSGELVLKASYDHEKGTIAHHNRKVDEWFLSRAVATGEPVTVKLPERPYRTVFGFRSGGSEGPVSVLSAPMRLRDRVTGVMVSIRNRSLKEFQPAEVSLVTELAGQAAMAIEQASLFAKVRTYASELETSYDSTLKALMAALDTKDAATEGHSERVSRLTVEVAREMGVPGERLVDIERGALLHDVGKIGVPDSVLRKPSALTKKEWEAMQKHPLLAGLMVSKVGFLEGAMPILLYHHERFDGTGYPFGLSGDKIPLEARIFAVSDAFDAITSERPYRRPSSPRQAVDEIQANAGTQFDPVVVEAFVAVMERRLAEEEAQEASEAA